MAQCHNVPLAQTDTPTMELTLGQFSKQSNTAKTTVRRWIEKGLITGIKIGNSYRIDASELDRVESIKGCRVSPLRHPQVVQTDTPKTAQVAPLDDTAKKIEILELKLATEKARTMALETERDEWREQAKRLAITHEKNQKSLFSRLFGQ